MRSPDAFIGIKRIYTSQILSLIGAGLAIIAAIFGIFGASNNLDSVAGGGALVGTGLLVLGAVILLIIAFVLQIMGVNTASKDETLFGKALMWLIIGIVVSIIDGFLQETGPVVSGIADTLKSVCQLLTTYFIIKGISSLADKMNNPEVKSLSEKTLKLTIGVYVVAIIFDLIGTFLGGTSSQATDAEVGSVGIIGVIALFLSILAYIVFLVLLSRAKTMLME